jgi:hypothetical protein
MTRLRVGFDLDGVLYDFAASFARYLTMIGVSVAWPLVDGEPVCWYFYRQMMSDAEFVAHFRAGVDAGVIFSGPARPGAAESVRRIREAGHSIHIVTDRSLGSPGRAQALTVAWLAEHGIGYDALTFSADKTVAALDVMVEDKIENWQELTAAGIPTYLVDRPWNTGHDVGEFRIPDVLDYARAVTEGFV